MCQEWKICIVGHPQTPWVHKARGAWDPCNTILRKVKPSCVNQTYFSVSSLPQCWSQAVVCISTPRKYPDSGYFQVLQIFLFWISLKMFCCKIFQILIQYSSVSSRPQCWSQAVVCISTPRKYPRSIGYFQVLQIFLYWIAVCTKKCLWNNKKPGSTHFAGTS